MLMQLVSGLLCVWGATAVACNTVLNSWEYNLPPGFVKPHGNDSQLEQFIRNKYERGKWKRKAGDPPMSAAPTPSQSASVAAEDTQRKDADKQAEKVH